MRGRDGYVAGFFSGDASVSADFFLGAGISVGIGIDIGIRFRVRGVYRDDSIEVLVGIGIIDIAIQVYVIY